MFFKPNVEKLKKLANIDGLIKALKYKDVNVREGAAEALGHLCDPRAVEKLNQQGNVGLSSKALNEKNNEVRKAVESLVKSLEDCYYPTRRSSARSLGQIGDARAVHPLVKTLADHYQEVREAAAESLEKLGWKPDQAEAGTLYWIAKGNVDKCVSIGAPAVEVLIKQLNHESVHVRSVAAKALGQLSDARSKDSLVLALGDKSYKVREVAANALEKLGWQPDQGEIGATYWAAKGNFEKCISIGAPAVGPLINLLNNIPIMDNNSGSIAEALGQIGDIRAVEPLINALLSTKPYTYYNHVAIALALGKLGDTRAVDPLLSALIRDYDNIATEVDLSTPVYQAIAKALGQIGDDRALEPLIRLKNTEPKGSEVYAKAILSLRKNK